MTDLKRSIGAFLVALFIGSFGGLFFGILLLTGRLRIHGYWKLMRQVAQGNTIIAANHPTKIETVILPVLFWPWAVLWQQRFFPWSMPDEKFFQTKWLNWLYDVAHCIKVDRQKHCRNTNTYLQSQLILKNGGTVIVHPEGGRTGSPRSIHKPLKPIQEYRNRQLRSIVSGVTHIARNTNATIVPVWIDIPFWQEANGFRKPLKLWFTRFERVSVHVGTPYQITANGSVDKPTRLAELNTNNTELGERILRAGLQ